MDGSLPVTRIIRVWRVVMFFQDGKSGIAVDLPDEAASRAFAAKVIQRIGREPRIAAVAVREEYVWA